MDTAINTRMGAQVLVQSNAFKNVSFPVTSEYSKQVGYVAVHSHHRRTHIDC